MKDKKSGWPIAVLVIIALMIAGGIIKAIPAIFKLGIWLLILLVVLLIAIVIMVIVLALRGGSKKAKPVPDNNKSDGNNQKRDSGDEQLSKIKLTAEQENLLTKGKLNIVELRKIIARIKDPEVREKSTEICDINERILRTLREKPEQIQTVRQFLNYYLPTLGEILVKYKRIESSGIPAEASEKKVEKYLDDIKRAMQKQYENLYEDDKLDLSVDMETMTMAVKRDGLIDDEQHVTVKNGDDEITLTL